MRLKYFALCSNLSVSPGVAETSWSSQPWLDNFNQQSASWLRLGDWCFPICETGRLCSGSLCPPGPQISTCFHQNISDNSHGCFALRLYPSVVELEHLIAESFSNVRTVVQSCLTTTVMLTLTKDKRFWIRRWARTVMDYFNDLPIHLGENNLTQLIVSKVLGIKCAAQLIFDCLNFIQFWHVLSEEQS